VLAKVNILGIELDKCHTCDGLWFDRGELEHVRDSKVTDVETAIERKYGDPKPKEGQSEEGHMQCPRCDGRLHRHSYTYTKPVYVDRCGKCLGFWLDDGELDTIVGQREKMDKELAPGRLKVFLRSLSKIVPKSA
jgi:Zn-finger nucleic acid-binding protein